MEISLLDVIYEVEITPNKRRLKVIVVAQLSEYGAGFRKERTTADQIFTKRDKLKNYERL